MATPIEEFIDAVSKGEVEVRDGGEANGTFYTTVRPLTLDDDVESITAEAFAAEVFDVEDTEWDEAVDQVREAIAAREP